jgi:hypothetical protein
MSITTYSSVSDQVDQVIADVRGQGIEKPAKAVLVFASVKYPQAALYKAVADLFPHSAVFGCSTAGEIVSGKMIRGGVAIMLLGDDVLEDVCVQVVENVNQKVCVDKAFGAFGAYFHTPVPALDIAQYVGIVLCDGLSGAEENLMDTLGNATDVTFIGGSAGDDVQFKQTYVYANGQVYTNAAVLALLKPKFGFDVIKTQSSLPLSKTLVATDVDEANRMVFKFDGKPARVAYAEAVGVAPEQAGDEFMRHPLGLMVDGEPYVRSPQRFEGDSMVLYCNIKRGVEYQLLQSTDIVAGTRTDLQAKSAQIHGKMAAIVNFNCILRTLELEEKGQTQAYGELFKDIPTVGFSTYGEEYIGHVNQTATMLVIKSK